jgi:hypothetical protein
MDFLLFSYHTNWGGGLQGGQNDFARLHIAGFAISV